MYLIFLFLQKSKIMEMNVDHKHNPPGTKETGRVKNKIPGTADQHKNTDQLENEFMTSSFWSLFCPVFTESVNTGQDNHQNEQNSLNKINTTTSPDDKFKIEKKHLSVQEKDAADENPTSLIPKKVMTKPANLKYYNMGDANLPMTSWCNVSFRLISSVFDQRLKIAVHMMQTCQKNWMNKRPTESREQTIIKTLSILLGFIFYYTYIQGGMEAWIEWRLYNIKFENTY